MFRLVATDASRLRERTRPHAIEHPKVERLCFPAELRRDIFKRKIIHLGRGQAMNVETAHERIDHFFIPGEFGGDAEFELRIIERDKEEPGVRDERAPDGLPMN